MEAAEPSKLVMRFRIGYACVGCVLGLSVAICFGVVEEFLNLHIALWGLASGLFALMTLGIHLQHFYGDRDLWVYRLKFFILLGFFISIGSVIAFIVYIVLAATQGQTLMPVNGDHQGYYLASIWVFMTWKWSFALFMYSRSYRKSYTTRYVAIP